jgi:hypothetical protein
MTSEAQKAANKRWRLKNKERLEHDTEYRERRLKYLREYYKKRYESDPEFRKYHSIKSRDRYRAVVSRNKSKMELKIFVSTLMNINPYD